MGSLFGGQSDDQTTKVEFPKWVDEASQNIYGAAEQTAERPYPLYDSSRIAPLNPDQQQSFDLARSNVDNWQAPYGMALASGVNAVTPVGEQDINRYMNPYTQAVTDTTREELYSNIEKNARLNSTYVILVVLSTIVVAIGLLEDNVAVVIGAMVIAPLLGPNIALALATALGDTELIWKSLKTGAIGFVVALGLSILIGKLWHLNFDSRELLARTDVGLDSIALALASGAAAVLSLSTGLPSVLVGVMVAVALLPPTATMGLMLGAGKFQLAVGAALLLAVNVVSVNLSAKVTFLARGIKPRTGLEKQKARQSMTTYIVFWVVALAILIVAIYLRPRTLP